ncbi:hypothetical protein Ac2012v2_8331 [Leucoagaricus gongylophorus]
MDKHIYTEMPFIIRITC